MDARLKVKPILKTVALGLAAISVDNFQSNWTHIFRSVHHGPSWAGSRQTQQNGSSGVILTAIHWECCFLLTNINHYTLRETYGRFNDSAVGQNSVRPWVWNTNSMRHFALHPQSLTVPPWRMVVGRRSFPIGARSLFRAFPIKLRVGNCESVICLFTNLCLTKITKKVDQLSPGRVSFGFRRGLSLPMMHGRFAAKRGRMDVGNNGIGELPQMLKCIHAHAHDWDTEIQYSISMKRIYRERNNKLSDDVWIQIWGNSHLLNGAN